VKVQAVEDNLTRTGRVGEDDVVEVDGAAERSMRRGSRNFFFFAFAVVVAQSCPPLEP